MIIPNRANTPEQKEEVLRRIAEYWATFPDMRLMQLLTWALGAQGRGEFVFYVEDYDLLDILEKTYTTATLNQSDGTENYIIDPGTLGSTDRDGQRSTES